MKSLLQPSIVTFISKIFDQSIGKHISKYVTYVQGQSPSSAIREYFYYIDHHGQLFLDDSKMKNFTSCFKDKEFLAFFFKRLRRNETDRYREEFPYVSLCGRERNFVRCDDLPIVFTEIIKDSDGVEWFSFCHAGDKLKVRFSASQLCMLPSNGRVYHVAEEKYGGVGLVRSGLAIELSKAFEFGNGPEKPPTHVWWNGERVVLTNEIVENLEKLRSQDLISRSTTS